MQGQSAGTCPGTKGRDVVLGIPTVTAGTMLVISRSLRRRATACRIVWAGTANCASGAPPFRRQKSAPLLMARITTSPPRPPGSLRERNNQYCMSAEIPWDESRKEWKPVDMTVTYTGNGGFTARTASGISYPMEAPVGMGGHGKYANPIQYLIGSLGGCVGVKILLALGDNGIVPQEMSIAIHGTRVRTMPAYFDRVHLVITLKAGADDAMVKNIIEQTLTRLCPIAAMFGEVGEVTFEQHCIR